MPWYNPRIKPALKQVQDFYNIDTYSENYESCTVNGRSNQCITFNFSSNQQAMAFARDLFPGISRGANGLEPREVYRNSVRLYKHENPELKIEQLSQLALERLVQEKIRQEKKQQDLITVNAAATRLAEISSLCKASYTTINASLKAIQIISDGKMISDITRNQDFSDYSIQDMARNIENIDARIPEVWRKVRHLAMNSLDESIEDIEQLMTDAEYFLTRVTHCEGYLKQTRNSLAQALLTVDQNSLFNQHGTIWQAMSEFSVEAFMYQFKAIGNNTIQFVFASETDSIPLRTALEASSIVPLEKENSQKLTIVIPRRNDVATGKPSVINTFFHRHLQDDTFLQMLAAEKSVNTRTIAVSIMRDLLSEQNQAPMEQWYSSASSSSSPSAPPPPQAYYNAPPPPYYYTAPPPCVNFGPSAPQAGVSLQPPTMPAYPTLDDYPARPPQYTDALRRMPPHAPTSSSSTSQATPLPMQHATANPNLFFAGSTTPTPPYPEAYNRVTSTNAPGSDLKPNGSGYR